jgi:signal transduction histidine kinase
VSVALGGFAAVTVALALAEAPPASPLRHLYLLPVVAAALRLGGLGGGASGLLAALLYAPLLLPSLERERLSAETLEGLLSLGLYLFVGGATGALAQRARAQATRYRTLLALQRPLTGEGGSRESLEEIVALIMEAFAARAVAIVLGRAASPLIAVSGDASPTLRSDSAVGWALATGGRLFLSDAADGRLGPPEPRPGPPRRTLVVPLRGREGVLGALAIERQGEFPRELRGAAETLALHLGLGLDNARLAERQRRFAEELEVKVAEATRRLRELDQAKSDFVSIVSHEIRTPLTSLQGFAELLLARPASWEAARPHLAIVRREAERLGRIVADLLDLSRIERGGARALARRPLALEPLVEANAELFAAQHPGREIRHEVARGLPVVLADHDALDRVLKNLLSNALKYSPGGGPVSVWARAAPEDPGAVELGVEDRGVGIPSEALPRIFDMYVRLSHPDTRRVRGLGLGLALVKALVEAHGGRVRVESRVGEGSRFVVTLPCAPAGTEAVEGDSG